MNILFYGLGLFALAWAVHLVIWRLYLPANHSLALTGIFFGIFIAGLFIIPLERFSEYLRFSFLFLSISAAYIANYPAVEVDSPSLVMIMAIARAGSRGLDKGLFEEKMNDEALIIPRINDLLKGKMVYMEGDRYRLKPSGRFVAQIFIWFRRLIGIQQLGG